jgi:hypothetical protein
MRAETSAGTEGNYRGGDVERQTGRREAPPGLVLGYQKVVETVKRKVLRGSLNL